MRYIVCVLIATLASISSAQAPPTIEEFLRTKNVPNNAAALEVALKSNDPSVRGAAAMQLSVLKVANALPAIRAALDREHDPQEMLNIARALSSFGDPHGEVTQRLVCSNSNTSDDMRLQAAQDLSPDLGSSCIVALSRMAGASSHGSTIYAALRTLAGEHPQKAPDLGADPTVVHAFQAGLQSDRMVTRVEAARCVAIYKAHSAAPAISAAITKEADPDTKKEMLKALNALSQ